MPKQLLPGQNTGVLILPPAAADWIASVTTGITFAEVNPSGNWEPWLSDAEWQWKKYEDPSKYISYDTMACVSFSALNVIETQINYFLDKGLLTVETVNFLYNSGFLDADGKLNCSDRFLAKMSGTTINGNYLNVVAQTLRQFGCVPEKMWSWDILQTPTFADYYKEIPQQIKDFGRKFLEHFDIQYEWITGSQNQVSRHLKQSPIQIAIPVCPGYSTASPIGACTLEVGHAVTLDRWDGAGQPFHIFDHYNPFNKLLAADYPIPYRLKIVVLPKKGAFNMAAVKLIFNYKGKVGIMTIDGEAMSGEFARDIPQLVKLGEAIGKPVQLSPDGTAVTNIDINIV